MKKYQQFINGALVDSNASQFIEVENPYSGEIMAQAPQGDEVDAQLALDAAQKSQDAWAAQPAIVRAQALKKMAAVIRENRLELARILASEQAKVLPLAQIEVDFTADYFDYYAGWARIYEGEIIQSDRPKENMLLYRQPMGVVVASALGTFRSLLWHARWHQHC